jgi:peptide deformylase
MTVRSVLRMGNPRLLEKARVVEEFDTPFLHTLCQDMHETMLSMTGVGLAAPQIGVSLRVVMFGAAENSRYPQAPPIPFTVLINPLIRVLDDRFEEDWEGCLSVPDLRGKVPRYKRIAFSGFDVSGALLEQEASGFFARVVQHECDHLDGVLYPQRMKDLRSFGFESEISQGR